MIDFAQQEMLPRLALLPCGNVLDGADETYKATLRRGAVKISTTTTLHPTDLSVFPHDPVLVDIGLRIDGIERRLADRPKPFHVVRMHPLQELFDRHLIVGKIANFLSACIERVYAVDRIVLPPPELGRVESKLQTCLARVQVLLRLLARVEILDHSYIAQVSARRIADDVH